MESTVPNILSQAADTISGPLRSELNRLASSLRPHLIPLRREAHRCWNKLGYAKIHHAGLDIIAFDAFLHYGVRQKGERFFSEVTRAATVLAKWNIRPAQLIHSLHQAESIVTKLLAGLPAGELSRIQPVRDQLRLYTVLAIQNAYYWMREEEANVINKLSQADYHKCNIEMILRGFVDGMSDYAGAAAGHLFLSNGTDSEFMLIASTATAASAHTQAFVPLPARLLRNLNKPLRIERGSAASQTLLDADWKKRFQTCWSLPVKRNGSLIGAFQFGFIKERDLLPRELQTLAIAIDRCVVTAHNAELLHEIAKRSTSTYAMAQRMLKIEEWERRRISRELHDDAAQSLVVVRLQLEMLEMDFPEDGERRERLAEIRTLTEHTILEVRRLISDLSPAVLQQLGLAAALRQLTKRFRESYRGSVRIQAAGLPPLDKDLETVMYRIAQECLRNIAQHSSAQRVVIYVGVTGRFLRLNVEHDGTELDTTSGEGRDRQAGLTGVADRVTLLGGKFHIDSKPAGNLENIRAWPASRIKVEIPIPEN